MSTTTSPLAYFDPRSPDGGQCSGASGGERVDEAGDGRVGGDWPEQLGLGPQHRNVRQAVPAQRDRQGQIEQDFAGIMHRPGLAPRLQGRRERGIQTGPPDRLHQQYPAGL
ncbi:hypothetical protein San01_61630 [Streptomyces angustmyceticus]|uniref:Uncharacterized protein n=1 Tax=Streptomyces angustmyceticus TaxID=285578 RepID=A0A5J4LTF5_9ACTN|nr:hypothetical protein San01_61630 [Streptomyces angustmyceticus]